MSIYEFGCGPGFNLVVLSRMFPKKKLYGLDWTQASCDIVNRLSEANGWNMEGRVFDFFSPDNNFKLARNSAIFTIGALEQTGQNYEKFLQYALEESPAICVNVEPTCEWYADLNLVDYLAILYHKRRKYWLGFLDRLRELEAEGRVKILKTKRSYFGSLFIEGYSQTIWKPTPHWIETGGESIVQRLVQWMNEWRIWAPQEM